jgi:hypothetical protein
MRPEGRNYANCLPWILGVTSGMHGVCVDLEVNSKGKSRNALRCSIGVFLKALSEQLKRTPLRGMFKLWLIQPFNVFGSNLSKLALSAQHQSPK